MGADGSLTLLGTLDSEQSAAYGIPANGAVIVGSQRTAQGVRVPSDGQRASGWKTSTASTHACWATAPSWRLPGVSPDGRYIVGAGYNAATNRFVGFLLDTVPEPASLLALGVGLVGLLRHDANRNNGWCNN